MTLGLGVRKGRDTLRYLVARWLISPFAYQYAECVCTFNDRPDRGKGYNDLLRMFFQCNRARRRDRVVLGATSWNLAPHTSTANSGTLRAIVPNVPNNVHARMSRLQLAAATSWLFSGRVPSQPSPKRSLINSWDFQPGHCVLRSGDSTAPKKLPS